jgi:hypothetical protein
VTRPSLQVCPLCASGEPDDVAVIALGPQLWQYTCSNVGRHHKNFYTWESLGTVPLADSGYISVSERLGVYDDIVAVLTRLGQFAEHGVVEYEYALENPTAYRELVERYSHTALGETQYSASSFLGSACGRMWGREQILYREVQATGRWAYNHRTGAWALPGNEASTVLTWLEYALEHDLEPDDWPLERLLGGET